MWDGFKQKGGWRFLHHLAFRTNDDDLILVLPWFSLLVKNAQFLHESQNLDDKYREWGIIRGTGGNRWCTAAWKLIHSMVFEAHDTQSEEDVVCVPKEGEEPSVEGSVHGPFKFKDPVGRVLKHATRCRGRLPTHAAGKKHQQQHSGGLH